MLHTEPIVLLPHDLPGEPLGPNDRESLDTDAISVYPEELVPLARSGRRQLS
jgi:hypothetical protein